MSNEAEWTVRCGLATIVVSDALSLASGVLHAREMCSQQEITLAQAVMGLHAELVTLRARPTQTPRTD